MVACPITDEILDHVGHERMKRQRTYSIASALHSGRPDPKRAWPINQAPRGSQGPVLTVSLYVLHDVVSRPEERLKTEKQSINSSIYHLKELI